MPGDVAKIAATLRTGGTVPHLNDWCFITFGAQDGARSERVPFAPSAAFMAEYRALVADPLVRDGDVLLFRFNV